MPRCLRLLHFFSIGWEGPKISLFGEHLLRVGHQVFHNALDNRVVQLLQRGNCGAHKPRAVHCERDVRGPWQCQAFAFGCGCRLLCSANVQGQPPSLPGRMPALSREPSKYEARHALENPILRPRRMSSRVVDTHCRCEQDSATSPQVPQMTLKAEL